MTEFLSSLSVHKAISKGMSFGFDDGDMSVMSYDDMLEARDYIHSLDIPPKFAKKKKPNKQFDCDFVGVSELLSEQTRKPKPMLRYLDQHGEVSRMFDTKTGEVFTFEKKGKKSKRVRTKEERLTDKFSLQAVAAKLLPDYRVAKCGCCVQSKTHNLRVYKSKQHDTVSISNLQSCGSVWLCAYCAAKIAERRRQEILVAMAAHKAFGGSVSFCTRTVPHTKNDGLKDIQSNFRHAEKLLKGHRSYMSLMKETKVIGSIKVFEITVGKNGWHLHVHEIYFHAPDAFEGSALMKNPNYVAFLKNFESQMYSRWRLAAVKAGFKEPSVANGLQIQNGDFAAEYVSKWGIEPSNDWAADSELTKSHMKKSNKGLSPFDLFRLYDETGDERLVPLIQEYGQVMHGQRQLIWSRGLKKHFGITDISDEELAEKLEDDAEEIGVLSYDQWQFIIKKSLRTEVYLLAGQGWDVLSSFLQSFADYPEFSFYDPLTKLDDFD